jgi:josephin
MSTSELYHERQKLALCAVHAVNNLLQRPRFSKADFDHVCEELSDNRWTNPHRSILPIGNFDVNVVSLLLQQEFLTVTWHDQRTDFKLEEKANLLGILWNVPSTSLWGRMTRGRHWIALSFQDERKEWMNLDSGLSVPVLVGSHEACMDLLNSYKDVAHVLFVTTS